MRTFADVDNFLSRYNGKSVDRDGRYGAQCVDFAAQYTSELYGVNYLPTPRTNGARDVYEQFSLGSKFNRIPNTLAFIPRKGDVVVWGAMTGNQYGHIAIADGEGDTNYFYSYDQNWGNVKRVQRIRHNYKNVLGVLRPKELQAAPAPQQGVVMDTNAGRELYRTGLFREPENDSAGSAAQWNGRSPADALKVLRDSSEWQANARKLKDYDALAKSVQELSARPTKAELENITNQLKASAERVAVLEQEVIAAQNKPNEDTELLDQTGNWLSKLIARLFKK
jgi:hypothetical protein